MFDWLRVIEFLVVLGAAALTAYMSFRFERRMERIRLRTAAYFRIRPLLDAACDALMTLHIELNGTATRLDHPFAESAALKNLDRHIADGFDMQAFRGELARLRASVTDVNVAVTNFGQARERERGLYARLYEPLEDVGFLGLCLMQDIAEVLNELPPDVQQGDLRPQLERRGTMAKDLRSLAARTMGLWSLHGDIGAVVHNHLLQDVTEHVPPRKVAEPHLLVFTENGIGRADRAGLVGKEARNTLAEIRRAELARGYLATRRNQILTRAGADPNSEDSA